MRLRFIDGFDMVDYTGSRMKYEGYSATFDQGAMIPGRPGPGFTGQSWWVFNTASGQANYQKILDTQAQWFIGFDLRLLINGQPDPSPQQWAACDFYKIGYSGGDLLVLHLRADGKIEVRDGTGAVLGTTTQVFAVGNNTWGYLEINAIYGTGGSWELWYEGVKILFGSANLTSNLPDRFTYRSDAGTVVGFNLDNYNISDGSGSEPLSSRRGRQRVTSLYGTSLDTGGWAFYGSLSSALLAVGDRPGSSYSRFPDGDGSYISPNLASAVELMQFSGSPCFGLNYGAAINACARPLSGSTLSLVVRERQSTNVIAAPTLVDTGSQYTSEAGFMGYRIYQGLVEASFETGTNWTDAQISNSVWGVKADPSTVAERVTQMFVEKLTTLDSSIPFSCGQSSYSY